MIPAKEILEYYLSENFKPLMPTKTQWRHFRFKQENGNWKKAPLPIRNNEELQKWIIKMGGLDIYYSTAQWLNPEKISTKGHSGTYHVAHNLLLKHDLALDIDAQGIISNKTVEEAARVTSELHSVIKTDKTKILEYCSYTGLKGFRLVYNDESFKLPANALERLDYTEENRKVFILETLEKIERRYGKARRKIVATHLDYKITTNPLCVIRVLNTVHSTTGYLSTKINISDLKTPIKKLLQTIPHIQTKRLGIPDLGEMTSEKRKTPSGPRSRLLKASKDVTSLASLPTNHGTHKYFFTNRVLGARKNYVPIFIYQDNQTYYEKEVVALQKKYKLGPLYIYQSGPHKIVVSLKSMQKRQLQKVLNESSSKTKRDFKKHGRIFAPFMMYKIKVLKTRFTGHLSRGHQIYCDLEEDTAKNYYCGWEQLELIKGEYNQ